MINANKLFTVLVSDPSIFVFCLTNGVIGSIFFSILIFFPHLSLEIWLLLKLLLCSSYHMIYGSERNGSCLSSPDFIKQTYCEKHNPELPQMTLRPRLRGTVWASRWRCLPSFLRRDDLVVIEPERWRMIRTANLTRCHTCHFLGSWNIIEACSFS